MPAQIYQFPGRKKELSITFWIIAVNLVVFLVALVLYSINPDFLRYLALQPSSIVNGQYLWTILTSMFTHVELWHIFANMVSLMFVGSFAERILGRKRYLWFYMIAGLFAGLFFVSLSVLFGNTLLGQEFFGSPDTLALGASGAIFGIAGLITVLIPRMRVLVFFVIPMRMWMAMVFFLGFFWLLSAFAGLPIGNSAHLGGFVIGLAYGSYLKYKFPRKTEMIKRYFS